MELHNINAVKAATDLMEARQQIKNLEERELKLRDAFATTIFLDAIEQPSRVLEVGTYWRITGLLPTDVCRMVDNFLKTNDNPDFAGLRCERVPVRRRYVEYDQDGNPTGHYIIKTEERTVLINLGEVKPPRKCTGTCQYNKYGKCAHTGDGRCSPECKEWQKKEPVLGARSLLITAPLCADKQCYYLRNGKDCPERPENKWKCHSNWRIIQGLIDQILAQY